MKLFNKYFYQNIFHYKDVYNFNLKIQHSLYQMVQQILLFIIFYKKKINMKYNIISHK